MLKSAYLLFVFILILLLNCNFLSDDFEPGNIVVYAPVANAEYKSGETIKIKWRNTEDYSYDATIKLYRNGLFEQVISSYFYTSSYDTSSYSWKIPSNLETDSTYQIKVEHYDHSEINDLSGIFTITGIEPDTFEVDDKSTQANILPLGTIQEHSLLYNDSDWVKIYVQSGNLYRITTSSDLSHYVYVYDNLNYTYDASDYGTATEINYTATSNDTLFILVKHYDSYSSNRGEYTIKAEVIEADSFEVDNYYSQASLIIPDSTQSHSIISMDTDWMKLFVKAGNVYSISTSSDFTHYLTLYLNPEQSSNDNTSGTDNTLNITPSEDDTLYIKVNYYSNSSTYYGNYNITVSALENDSYENDNNYNNANLISLDSIQKHSIIGNDSDWVKVVVNKDKIYKISTVSGVKHYLYIFEDPYLGTVAYQKNNENSIYYTSTANDTIFILIKNYSSSSTYSGNYTIEVDTLNNVSTDIFNTPEAGDTIKTSTSYYYINWDSSNVLLGDYVYIYLYRNGRLVKGIASSYTTNDGRHSWSVPSSIETGDNYRIKIVNYGTSQNVSFFSDTFTIIGQTPDAYEDDDTKSLAKFISADTSQNHTIMYSDSDWVKMPVIGGRSYKITSNSNITHYLSLHTKSGTSAIKSTSGSNNSIVYNATKTDTIYAAISVSSSYSLTYPYLLETSTIVADTLLAFSFPKAGDTITTLTDTTVSYSNFSNYGSYLYLYLYAGDSAIDIISGNYESNDGSFKWQVSENLITGNNYRLYIRNSAGDLFAFSDTFSIKGLEPDSYENDNLRDSATLIEAGQIQKHTLTVNDSDWVKISIDSGAIYTINSKALYNHYLRLYNSNEMLCSDSSFGANGNVTFTAMTNDSVYALISNASDVGNYTIEVDRYHPDSLVKFIEPTASSVYSAGSSYSLKWDLASDLFENYVYAYLYKGTKLITKITSYVASSDSKTYSWSVPDNLETGSNYSIYVQDKTSAPTIQIISDTFSISGISADIYEDDDTISTAHMIGGEMETHTLTIADKDWFTFNGVKDSVYVFDIASSDNVKLYFYSDSGTVSLFGTTLKKKIWLCSETAPYHFYIDEYNNSDATGYTIKLSEYSTNQNLLTVVTPAEGDSVNAGSSVNIAWSNSNVFNGYVDIFLYKDNQLTSTIKSQIFNNGTYTWFIPSTTAKGAYSIRIVSRETSKIYGTSKSFIID